MKKILAALLCAAPFSAFADHLDVIQFKLKDGCTFKQHMEIVADFNSQFGAMYGYKAEVLVAIQAPDLVPMYWVGRSKDAATFGKAWDAWRDAQSNPDSIPGKLAKRFDACSVNISRDAYDTY